MHVVAVDSREIAWPLDPRQSARGAARERRAVILAVRCGDGATGLGEAAPLPGFSIDSLADAFEGAEGLVARCPFELSSPRHASAIADRVTAAPATRFAIETALLSAYAQATRTSIAHLLAARPHADLTSAVVVDDEDEAQIVAALGARCLKIKVGDDAAADLARVRAIARRAPGCTLRLDANRRWPADDIDRIFAALRDLPIDYVEEPCADAHQLLSCDLAIPIALDESLVELDRAGLARAIASPRLAALVLKPTLLGGFARCLELAALAHEHGVAPVVTHTLESPLGTAACEELARAIGADVPAGLAPHPALAQFREARWV